MIEPANLRGTCCGLAHIRNAQTAVPDIGADPWTDSHLKRGVSRSRRHDSRNYIRISKEGGVVKSNGQTGRCLQATAGSSPQPRRSMTWRPVLAVGRLLACEVSYNTQRRVKLQQLIIPPDELGPWLGQFAVTALSPPGIQRSSASRTVFMYWSMSVDLIRYSFTPSSSARCRS